MSRFNCLECGACCRAFGIVEVTALDIGVPQRLTAETELGYRRMKTESFTCCCLGEHNICLIYLNRPQVCRRFEVGGELCLMARKREGIDPP
jgi:hypothetical protein